MDIEAVNEIIAQLTAVLSTGAGLSGSALMKYMEGENDIADGTSLFTVLMSPSKSMRKKVYEALPELVPDLANKANGSGYGDASTWFCMNLVERVMICSKEDKRKVRQ